MALRVRAVFVGTLAGLPRALFTYNHGFDRKYDSPNLVFVIEGGEHPVLVDTGCADPEWTLRYHGYTLKQEPAEETGNALRDAGVDPAAVKTVIYTHLHWDHCYNSELFPNAEFVVQHSELRYAIDPLDIHRVIYEKIEGIQPPWFKAWDRMWSVEGDVPDLLPGISLVALPGHSPGSQGVTVEAARGRYVLAGDCVDTYENWQGSASVAHIPAGVHTSLIEFADSFAKLERLEASGWEIVPAHDTAVKERGFFE